MSPRLAVPAAFLAGAAVMVCAAMCTPDVPAPEAPAPVTEPAVEWHAMDEGPLICGPDAKPALDYNPHNGYGWWAYCEPALVEGINE